MKTFQILASFDSSEATEEDVEKVVGLVADICVYHAADIDQVRRMNEVRDAIAEAVTTVVMQVPPSPVRTRAINGLLDVRMLANQAIMFKGEL